MCAVSSAFETEKGIRIGEDGVNFGDRREESGRRHCFIASLFSVKPETRP